MIKNKSIRNLICKILSNSEKSYYRWKEEKRPIIALLEKYFTEKELEEFLETGKIEKQELIKDFSTDEIKTVIKTKHNQKILEQIENLKKELM